MAFGYNILRYIMEHSISQPLKIQNPVLPVREGQHCLSSFNRGAWNYQITMAEAVSIVPLTLAGCHFSTWMNPPHQPIILQSPIFQMHLRLSQPVVSVTLAPIVQGQPCLHHCLVKALHFSQEYVSIAPPKTASRIFQLTESRSSFDQEQLCASGALPWNTGISRSNCAPDNV